MSKQIRNVLNQGGKALVAALLLAIISIQLAAAETTGEKIQRTGVLTAGVWKGAKPFGYVDDKGEWVGYGVDLIKVIQYQLELALNKKIKLELVEANTKNRFDLVMKRKVDIECGPTTFTWGREKFVDFSIRR